MKSKLNSDIISSIKNRLPKDEPILPFLMDLLCLGKEAIYRRLRGEVAFAFEEVAAISSKLGFSIDKIAGLKQSERAFFDVALHNDLLPEEEYYFALKHSVNFSAELLKSKNPSGYFIQNHIPYVFSFYLETLSKFLYFKWMHQRMGVGADLKMAELTVPQKLSDLFKEWIEIDKKQKIEMTYIFDNNLFFKICREIDFFYKNGFLNDQEKKSLQIELSEMLNYLEAMSRSGVSQSNTPAHFYLLPFDLEASYMYFEFDGNTASCIQIYSMNYLMCFDKHTSLLQKNRIDQLKRYSVFISQSGEIVRLAYFNKQREYIAEIGTMTL